MCIVTLGLAVIKLWDDVVKGLYSLQGLESVASLGPSFTVTESEGEYASEARYNSHLHRSERSRCDQRSKHM